MRKCNAFSIFTGAHARSPSRRPFSWNLVHFCKLTLSPSLTLLANRANSPPTFEPSRLTQAKRRGDSAPPTSQVNAETLLVHSQNSTYVYQTQTANIEIYQGRYSVRNRSSVRAGNLMFANYVSL